jgi:hypothetical protein
MQGYYLQHPLMGNLISWQMQRARAGGLCVFKLQWICDCGHSGSRGFCWLPNVCSPPTVSSEDFYYLVSTMHALGPGQGLPGKYQPVKDLGIIRKQIPKGLSMPEQMDC